MRNWVLGILLFPSVVFAMPGTPENVTCPPGSTEIVESQDLESIVEAGAVDEVFCIKAGTHRIGAGVDDWVNMKAGQQLQGLPGAVISGSVPIDATTFVGVGPYKAPSGVTPRPYDNTVGSCAVDGDLSCLLANELFVDGERVKRVDQQHLSCSGGINDGQFCSTDLLCPGGTCVANANTDCPTLASGEWCLDMSSAGIDGEGTIVVADNPSGTLVELSVAPKGIVENLADDNVTIQGLTFQHFANYMQGFFEWVVGGGNSSGWLIDSNHFRNNNGTGVSAGNADVTISNNLIELNRHLGIGGGFSSSGITVTGNIIRENNRGGHRASNEAGGVKLAGITNCTVSGNTILDNGFNDGSNQTGKGLWLDVADRCTVSDNYIGSQNPATRHENGLKLELACEIFATGNVVENSWTRGIDLHDSHTITLTDNDMKNNGVKGGSGSDFNVPGELAIWETGRVLTTPHATDFCSGSTTSMPFQNFTITGNRFTPNDYSIWLRRNPPTGIWDTVIADFKDNEYVTSGGNPAGSFFYNDDGIAADDHTLEEWHDLNCEKP